MALDKTLLFVGAHPDDESFGPGATLAHYAAAGVRVYYACATRGEAGTIDAKHLKDFASAGDLRWAELVCATKVLGLAGLFHLGYRDSGMSGSADNHHPQALVNAPIEEVTARIVKIIREVRPQVVLTHGANGDYGHPDHIAVHLATTAAFHAAGDESKFPGLGAAFQPQKLYYNVFSKRLLKLAVRFLPLFGQDAKHFGRNKDIDLTVLTGANMPLTTTIKLEKQALKTKEQASACHKSQLEGGPSRRGVLSIVSKLTGQHDTFTRAFPLPDGRHEKDLFDRIDTA
ncbi:N-acetyl-1-D-myo-inosityl-2-amino-2-deoxy-alpha-D-glucopyranoside deacetylase MshB [Dehalogenimonas sp. WBC-2]|nr:N-acetyl-1-D-myo-inosityl-2-amino-2-deoxy-alpha-D-glucopyranoside deacetylase MshB [Dehalogenimonas sp. WBC-2]